MTAQLGQVQAEEEETAFGDAEFQRTDRLLLIGCLLSGTMVVGPFGAILLLIALQRHRRLSRAGRNPRPWIATVVGTFCLVDGSINFFAWTLDTFAHDTVIGHTFITGYGRMFDGAFFVHYNSGALGGVANHTEKMWQILAISMVMPLRMVSAWAFLQMRSWGLHFMRVSGWLYGMLWVGYTMAMSEDYQERLGRSIYHVPGWWLFNLFYLSPFFTLPYLYTLQARDWRR